MEEKTIFEKIIDGGIPATKVYEDTDFLAFLDIQPKAFGHTLLIPKKKVVWMYDSEDEDISHIFIKAKELMLAIKKGLSSDYVELRIVGEEVPHFHIHLIPRLFTDGILKRKSYESPEQMLEYAEKIKKAL
jgi:histidine triad (HIT) family protein